MSSDIWVKFDIEDRAVQFLEVAAPCVTVFGVNACSDLTLNGGMKIVFGASLAFYCGYSA